jgi:hypothetical protein
LETYELESAPRVKKSMWATFTDVAAIFKALASVLQHIERLLAGQTVGWDEMRWDGMGNSWEHSAFPTSSFMHSPGEMIERTASAGGQLERTGRLWKWIVDSQVKI